MARKERPHAYHCPHCGDRFSHLPDDHRRYTCPRCRTKYLVMIDAESGAAAMVDQADRPTVPPLGMPKGSIRALIALTTAGSCAAIVVRGLHVPGSLLSLLLTIIGFYFGFRTKAASLSDRVYDPLARREQPLWLPGGAIRLLLIATFAGAGLLLLHRGELADSLPVLEFFVILAGLVVGHFFGRAFSGTDPATRAGMGHVKGLVGLLVAGGLAWLFVTGQYRDFSPYTVMLLCALISFYFGSRS